MKYESITFLGERRLFADQYDVVRYYWTAFYNGPAYYNNIRILDCYSKQRVDIEIFVEIFNRTLNNRRKENLKRRYGDYKFRNGPVRGTGKRRRLRHWAGWRHPRTKQELTHQSTRTKRNNLPTAWDDIIRHTELNWKKQRKTQWKVK